MTRAKSLNVIILLQSTLHQLPKKRVISFGDKIPIRDHNCAQWIPRSKVAWKFVRRVKLSGTNVIFHYCRLQKYDKGIDIVERAFSFGEQSELTYFVATT